MRAINPERLAERVVRAIRVLRQPETPTRMNRLEALGALILGLMVGWVRWSQNHPDEAAQHQPKDKLTPVSRMTTQAQMTAHAGHAGSQQSGAKAGAEHKPFSFTPRVIIGLLKDTVAQWNEHRAPQLAAALAYYTIFSLAPLLIIAIAVAGLAFGQQAASNQVYNQIQGMIGSEGAQFIQSMIQNASKSGSGGLIATILGVITLLGGAAGVVAQLKSTLNIICDVKPKPGPGGIKGVLSAVKNQLLSFAMVLGIGFVLLVSLLLSALLAGITQFVGNRAPTFRYEALNFVVSFGVITLLFAAIYKLLPDADIKWRDVWIGAAITSLLFTIGKVLIGLYLGHSGTASSYGAAGSLVVVLLWVYYSAQILFFGAEFTRVYADQYGSNLVSMADESQPTASSGQPSQPRQTVTAHAGR